MKTLEIAAVLDLLALEDLPALQARLDLLHHAGVISDAEHRILTRELEAQAANQKRRTTA